MRRLRTVTSRYWGVVAIIILWQSWTRFVHVNAIVMPQPADVVGDLFISPRIYLWNAGQTMLLAILGLVIGMILGTVTAIIASISRILSGILVPISLIFSSVPVVLFIPVFARIFGYDVKTTLLVVAIISFFPAFVFTSSGLKSFPKEYRDLSAAFGASPLRRFIHLEAPAALPSWMVAFRLAASQAVLSAMVAEFLMGTAGLGHMFRTAMANFQTERAYGASLIATVVSVLCFTAATAMERRVNERWK
jgi:NitT/TauT family transport system permease protein